MPCPDCSDSLVPGVIYPMNTDNGVQRCDTCAVFPGDLSAALALGQRLGKTVKWLGTDGTERTYTGDVPEGIYIAEDTDPWLE